MHDGECTPLLCACLLLLTPPCPPVSLLPHVAPPQVGFDFVMMGTDASEYTKGPEDGIYIDGLFLEGCAWDAKQKLLSESKPKVLFEKAPVIWLQPKTLDQFSSYQHYSCPVYRTAERKGVLATTGHSTNFLMMIRMPTDKPDYHWTLRGEGE